MEFRLVVLRVNSDIRKPEHIPKSYSRAAVEACHHSVVRDSDLAEVGRECAVEACHSVVRDPAEVGRECLRLEGPH